MKELLEKVRIKLIGSREELEEVAVETAILQAKLESENAAKNEKLQEIAAEYDLGLSALGREIKANEKRLEIWALGNREAFGGKQSMTVAGHRLLYRRSPGKVAMSEGVKEADALQSALAMEDEDIQVRIVSVKASLDKQAIKEIWESGEAGKAVVRALGIEVHYPESFSFEPNLDEVPDTN